MTNSISIQMDKATRKWDVNVNGQFVHKVGSYEQAYFLAERLARALGLASFEDISEVVTVTRPSGL